MRKKTNDEFLEEIALLNPTYNVLSEYINIDTNVLCYCNIHNTNFYSTPYNLLNGKCGCESCRREKIGNKNRRSHDLFIDKISKINPNIKVIGKYTRCKDKIECKCKLHSEIFYITPDHLIQGEIGCKECIHIKNCESNKKSHDEFVKQIKSINNTINVIGMYAGAHRKIDVQCLDCGNMWSPVATSLLSGYGCPRCASSRGEKRIKNFLESYEVMFEPQKKFPNLFGVGGRHLSYDFYLPNFNILIEYQGQFHDGTALKQTEYEFMVQKEHDKRKAIYALDNGIQLIEIWYWDYKNIEKILSEILNNLENSVTTTII